MTDSGKSFQVFVKPISALCNLECRYCYYLDKIHLYPNQDIFKMPLDVVESYIKQHIEACPDKVVRFSWHGGEPTLLGLGFYEKIVEIQEKYREEKRVTNGIQTNGTLLDEEWCNFLQRENFAVGLSLDGPEEMHNKYRCTKTGQPSFKKTMNGYRLLQKNGVDTDILCVVNDLNVTQPHSVYNFFKEIGAKYITFLPLVEREKESENVDIMVSPEQWGDFLCQIFDEWLAKDIGVIKIQIIEEALRTAFNQEHSLCIFRPTCGDIPVLEHNGDLYSCDHYVDQAHLLGNIMETPLQQLLLSPSQTLFGEYKQTSLPEYCRECNVLELCNGGCPRNRFMETPSGEPGLNYLCKGYKLFFNHIQPFIKDVKALWMREQGLI